MTASAVAILSFANGAMAAGPPSLATHAKAQTKAHRFLSPDLTLNVLYDQNDSDDGIGIVSQNFESSFDAYDTQAADDFSVPSGDVWRVREVDVTGVYFNGSGPARTVTIAFYRNDPATNRPGRLLREYDNLKITSDDEGSFVILLPRGVGLHHGKHWMAVSANMDFASGGEWGWENRAWTNGLGALWRNPGNGFATGCSDWGVETSCVPAGQSGDDMFTLRGKHGGGA
jgi:hypothetical protein